MNPHPANPAEPPAPPAVDVSSEAVAERAGLLRRDGMSPLTADMLEALAADRDRLKSLLDGASHSIAIMAWNLGAEQRGTDAIAEDRDRLAVENARLASELEVEKVVCRAAEKAAIALENIASAFRKNESKMQAKIDELSKNQMPFGV